MPPELTWLIGQRLIDVAKRDWSWFFLFSDGGRIVAESDWRLVTPVGIEVASEDHGQIFGLKVPVDAAARVQAATNGKRVLEGLITLRTSDLTVMIEGGVSLEFLNLSSGYESWRAEHKGDEVISMGGGQLAIFPRDRKR